MLVPTSSPLAEPSVWSSRAASCGAPELSARIMIDQAGSRKASVAVSQPPGASGTGCPLTGKCGGKRYRSTRPWAGIPGPARSTRACSPGSSLSRDETGGCRRSRPAALLRHLSRRWAGRPGTETVLDLGIGRPRIADPLSAGVGRHGVRPLPGAGGRMCPRGRRPGLAWDGNGRLPLLISDVITKVSCSIFAGRVRQPGRGAGPAAP
jgi:hypothetical protein